jgi:hypothetical protein
MPAISTNFVRTPDGDRIEVTITLLANLHAPDGDRRIIETMLTILNAQRRAATDHGIDSTDISAALDGIHEAVGAARKWHQDLADFARGIKRLQYDTLCNIASQGHGYSAAELTLVRQEIEDRDALSAMTQAQIDTLTAIHESRKLDFQPRDWHPTFDLPEGYVAGRLGNIHCGVAPDGSVSS